MDNTLRKLFDTLMHPGEFELAAIWLKEPVITGDDVRTCRITEGTEITLKAGRIVDTERKPTHKVLGCFGTLNSEQLTFVLINNETLTPEILRVK